MLGQLHILNILVKSINKGQNIININLIKYYFFEMVTKVAIAIMKKGLLKINEFPSMFNISETTVYKVPAHMNMSKAISC